MIVTKVTDYIKGMGVSTAASLDLEKGWHHFSTLIEGCSNPKRPRVQVNPEDPALIQFTGGTTGIPKGAVLTHANVVAAALQCFLWGSTTYLTPPERRVVMAVLPYFHVYGNIVVMNWAMFSCATQIQIPRFNIDEMMNLLANFKEITFFPAVPTLINAVVNHPKAGDLDLAKTLKLLCSGAAPMPVELIEQVKDMGILLQRGVWPFGIHVAGDLQPHPRAQESRFASGCLCRTPMCGWWTSRKGRRMCPKGQPGEIIMKGPLIMQGYWNNPQETAGQLKDGWLYTGDIAVRDEDDYIFIVDRKKDMIIAGGFNIYPTGD